MVHQVCHWRWCIHCIEQPGKLQQFWQVQAAGESPAVLRGDVTAERRAIITCMAQLPLQSAAQHMRKWVRRESGLAALEELLPQRLLRSLAPTVLWSVHAVRGGQLRGSCSRFQSSCAGYSPCDHLQCLLQTCVVCRRTTEALQLLDRSCFLLDAVRQHSQALV